MEPGERIRVYLVDDHHVVRSGLKALIEQQVDMVVVGEAADGDTAVEEIGALGAGVVVMDLSMPKLGGAAATTQIVAAHPSTRVLVLTAHEERAYVQLVLDAGATGYMFKRAAPEDLVNAIRVVAAGQVYMDPAIAPLTRARRASEPITPSLSDRESEVLRMIAEGHAMKDIAATLNISTRTLETYRARAMEKLGLKTRAEVVRYALQCGWLKDG